jgi:hypothetical protein
MKKGKENHRLPRVIKIILIISLVIYTWYFISTLVLPLSEFVNIPTIFLMTFYKMLDFPPALLGFMVSISVISCVLTLFQFGRKKEPMESFLIDGTTFLLYFVIPIVATFLLLIFIVLRVSGQIPTTSRISYFLEDLFLFTSFLFVLTIILNIAVKKILVFANCCDVKKKRNQKGKSR